MYYKNYSFSLLTHVITFSLCFSNNKYHATATFINNNFITPGSTILVNWADSNYNNTIDIQLIERNHVENKSSNNDTTPSNNYLPIIAQLATNITSATKLYPVEIPISILSTTTYSIIISKEGTNLASSGPLKTLNSSTTKDSNNNTTDIILLSSITTVTTSNKALPLSALVADNSSSNTSQVTSSQYIDDIGPTLTSTQVAAIAMGFIGCSGVIFVIYFTFKWIKGRRALKSEQRIRERNQQQFIIHHDTTTLSNTDYFIPDTTTAINNRSAGSSSAHNGKAKKFFTLENINEEDNLYYLEPDSNKNNLKYDSLGPAPRQQRSSSPFGEPPQTFNGNRYTIDNDYSIIPPPPNAYPHQ